MRSSGNVFILSVNQGSSEKVLLAVSDTSHYLLCVSKVELKWFEPSQEEEQRGLDDLQSAGLAAESWQ
jgi:hypothetical protein